MLEVIAGSGKAARSANEILGHIKSWQYASCDSQIKEGKSHSYAGTILRLKYCFVVHIIFYEACVAPFGRFSLRNAVHISDTCVVQNLYPC